MVNIMAQLPNNLIMDIIRLADGGLNTHKQKFKSTLDYVNSCGKQIQELVEMEPRLPEMYKCGSFDSLSMFMCENTECMPTSIMFYNLTTQGRTRKNQWYNNDSYWELYKRCWEEDIPLNL